MKKKKLIIVGLIIAILAGGGLYYWNFTTSPKYSLYQVKTALEEHDITKFEKYVDIDGVISSLIDQAIEINNQGNQTTDEWEQLGKDIGTGLVKMLKPQLTEIYKRQIVKLVETGTIEKGDKKNEDLSFSLADIWTRSSNVTGIEYIKKEGKIAYVGLGLKQEKYDTVLIFNIKLRNKGSYWQIAELPDVSKLSHTINELEEQRITELNKPIIEEMYSTLKISNYIKNAYTTDYWGMDQKVKIRIEIMNTGTKPVAEYQTVVNISDLNHKFDKTIEINSSDGILEPNKTQWWTWSNDVNMFIPEDNLLYKTPTNQLILTLTINYIRFTDGSELKLHQKWED